MILYATLFPIFRLNVINVNLLEKPEWFSKLSPTGQVPFLKHGDFEALESLNLILYLESKHPYPQLKPSTPEQEAMDFTLITLFHAKVEEPFLRLMKNSEDAVKDFMAGMHWMEEELIKRGSFLFGGR